MSRCGSPCASDRGRLTARSGRGAGPFSSIRRHGLPAASGVAAWRGCCGVRSAPVSSAVPRRSGPCGGCSGGRPRSLRCSAAATPSGRCCHGVRPRGWLAVPCRARVRACRSDGCPSALGVSTAGRVGGLCVRGVRCSSRRRGARWCVVALSCCAVAVCSVLGSASAAARSAFADACRRRRLWRFARRLAGFAASSPALPAAHTSRSG